MTTTRATWLRFISGAVLAVLLISGLLAMLQVRSSNHAASVAVIPRCVDTQLAVTGVGAPGGLSHAGLVIHFRNVGLNACSLTGYPNVVGINFETGKSLAALHVRDGYLGGWMGYENGKAKPLPIVVLHARGGAASSMVQWVDAATAQGSRCPVLTSLWVDARGGTRPYALKTWMLVCGYLDANPIVRGTTGRAD